MPTLLWPPNWFAIKTTQALPQHFLPQAFILFNTPGWELRFLLNAHPLNLRIIQHNLLTTTPLYGSFQYQPPKAISKEMVEKGTEREVEWVTMEVCSLPHSSSGCVGGEGMDGGGDSFPCSRWRELDDVVGARQESVRSLLQTLQTHWNSRLG